MPSETRALEPTQVSGIVGSLAADSAGYNNGAGGGGGGDDSGWVVENQGAGGGGGNSYVDPTADSTITPLTATANEPGGTDDSAGASITWTMCRYDLAVSKVPGPSPVTVGDTASWSVTVQNNGPDGMSQHFDAAGVEDTSASSPMPARPRQVAG